MDNLILKSRSLAQWTVRSCVLAALLVSQTHGQSSTTKTSDSSDNEGIGMAEIIAIVVCLLVIAAFILACAVMLRNQTKRRKM